MRAIVWVGLALGAASCGGLSAEQRAAMAKVQIVQTDPAANCQNLGPVSGSPIQLKASKLGANTVKSDAAFLHGTAFFCPPPAAAPAPPPIVHP